jgi:hypothetical protein
VSWPPPQSVERTLQQLQQLEHLHERQKWVAVILAGAMLALVVELLRRRKLREEYSWVWVGTALLLIGLAFSQDLLQWIGDLVGSATATSTLFFGAILFLLLLALQFSVRLSKLTHRHRTLGQRVALLEAELRRKNGEQVADDAGRPLPLRDDASAMRGNERQRRDGVA